MRTKKETASLAAKWNRSREMARAGNDAGAGYSDWDRVLDLEVDVLVGPIRSLDDALAKLRAIELSFLEGERTDGADVTALRQTIRWLSTRGEAA
jgi:hypothetical protein